MRFLFFCFSAMTVWGQGSVPLRRAGAHLFVDGVMVNGSGPFRFALDTGAQSTVVAPAIAERLGLRPSYRVETVTVNGSALVPATMVTSVTLGPATVRHMEVSWHPLPGLDGILGQNFLRGFRYGIDLGRMRLHLEDGFQPGGVRLPLETWNGRPGVRLGGLRLVIDSGAPALVLFRSSYPGLVGKEAMQLGTSLGGSRTVVAGTLPRLQAGGIFLRNVPVALHGGGRSEVDGLLPVTLFAAVWVDPREGVVILR